MLTKQAATNDLPTAWDHSPHDRQYRATCRLVFKPWSSSGDQNQRF